MIKQIALLKARPGMDHAGFVERYETGHAPLVDRLLPLHQSYSRNYIKPADGPRLDHAAGSQWFDVMTMLGYAGPGKLVELGARLAQPGVADSIQADAANLFDGSMMQVIAVDERVTPQDQLQSPPPGFTGRPQVKQIAFIKRNPAMSAEAFRDYYETQHAPLALKMLARDGKPIFAGYARNYPIADANSPFSGQNVGVAPFDYDVISEFWFWTRADFEFLVTLHGMPEVDEAMKQDEARVFDRTAIVVREVDERVSPNRRG